MKTAVYPGTFNPITNGHSDLVERAAKLFDKVIVAIGVNRQKSGTLPTEKRVELARQVLGHLDNVEVCSFDTLLIDFVREREAKVILRGLRTVADFEYEFQLVGMNRALDPKIETIFMAPEEHLSYISSTLVREIASFGGDISRFVHPLVDEAMKELHRKEKS
ncbi:phosphopantetheine adenylyltransferase [Pseudohongiella nitratireducens]|jgi:pantetheine-phosphate adenylyltransferase|uniref:Phosphopantetheine adenylyltransferase n=1 Tax=Pseudohongiella nitratireducens TaxID=1768907 RepID=A0A917LQH9_9GAMM|nr:pantetheine-phosphate adenylyltransferase [Pseudohongiella nitratireducens]MDF1622087.1 pantetheine-phosphate adenylyltransferase [Pseudohongiella nitratireducens]GGG51510.1 phosphopantetheine adenylyltransferase [Pseudohongiella nitratireducens]|tara:strand:+ start:8312 stop:8800 length:489 start_codon:yes stop_codon:yes gene_type:complete